MMSKVAVKFAVSSLVLAMTTVACKPSADMARPASYSARAAAKAEHEAAKHFARAENAVRQGDLAAALVHAEEAVALSPRDVGYRMALADLYLKNGRFLAAETSFADVLELNPGNKRASLNLVLVEIALGKAGVALNRLDGLAGEAAPADLGLAYALAGDPERAIALLEPAARAADANGRVRQNLALAFALAGDWQKARVTAAQDISPAHLDGRLRQWAALAQPEASWTQVASLLGVTPVEDAGQPVRLALAPPAPEVDAVRYAEAPVEPVAVVAAATPVAEAPLRQADLGTIRVETPIASEVEPAQPVLYAQAEQPVLQVEAAVQTLVAPRAALIRASAPIADAPVPAFAGARSQRLAAPAKAIEARPGRFVVQLGAFSSGAAVERAWADAQRRYPLAAQRIPVSTTVSIPGKGTLHRLSVSGFATEAEAGRLCSTIRAKGGACFVRAIAGDQPVRWASRAAHRG